MGARPERAQTVDDDFRARLGAFPQRRMFGHTAP